MIVRTSRSFWLRSRRHPLLSVLAVLCLIELVLQIVLVKWREHTYFFPERNVPPSSRYAEDADLFWMPNDGFRSLDRQTEQTKPEDRLFFFGDSVVYGHRDPANSYPAWLQKRLDADPRRKHFRVLNYAYFGYTSQQSEFLASRVLRRFKGRMVFFSHGANDLARVRLSDRQVQEMNHGAGKRLLYWFNHVKLFALYRHWLLSLQPAEVFFSSGKIPRGIPRVSPDEFRENLTTFATLSREAGARLVLMSEENEAPGNRATLDPYFDHMAETAKHDPGVVYLDIRPYFRQLAGSADPDYSRLSALPIFVDVCHYSTYGNQLVADYLYRELIRQGLLD